jgi:hypothetical protein
MEQRTDKMKEFTRAEVVTITESSLVSSGISVIVRDEEGPLAGYEVILDKNAFPFPADVGDKVQYRTFTDILDASDESAETVYRVSEIEDTGWLSADVIRCPYLRRIGGREAEETLYGTIRKFKRDDFSQIEVGQEFATRTRAEVRKFTH